MMDINRTSTLATVSISIKPTRKALRYLATARTALWGAVNGFIISIPFILYALDIIPIR